MFVTATLPTYVKCLTKSYTKDVTVRERNTFRKKERERKEFQKMEAKKKMVEKQACRLLKRHSQDENDHSDVATIKRKDIRFI